jgi:predicted ATPase
MRECHGGVRGGYLEMSKFKRIRIKGFRRLNEVDLELRPLTVMIGANGVGKTSILDVFSLLSASAGAKLNEKLSELGGIGSLLTYGRANSLALSLDMDVPGYEPLVYEINIAPKWEEGDGHKYISNFKRRW